MAFTGCKQCDCENTGTAADRSELNKDGTGDAGATSVNVQNEAPSTRYGGSTSGDRSTQESDATQSTGTGVGNADAETGTLEKDAKATTPAAKTPSKPGTIGTRATRGAGTGTSQGRQVN